MSSTKSLDQRIASFKVSSSFTSGDALSFGVNWSDTLRLPGKYDPTNYLIALGLDVRGKKVLVVCPGNSGLCVAAIRDGADTVVAYEPRSVYQKSVTAIAGFTSDAIGRSFDCRSSIDRADGRFDVIIWSEGVEDVRDVKSTFDYIVDVLAPGGQLYIELAHGSHGKIPATTNSWRPTLDNFKSSMADYSDLKLVREQSGRNQTRRIYSFVCPKICVDSQTKDASQANRVDATAQRAVSDVVSVKPVATEATAVVGAQVEVSAVGPITQTASDTDVGPLDEIYDYDPSKSRPDQRPGAGPSTPKRSGRRRN